MRTLRSAALAASLTSLLALTTVTAVGGSAVAEPGGRPLSTAMTGEEEAPILGDLDATGMASFTLNQGRGLVCFDLSWADVDGTVVAAHIHEAPEGEPGDVVVPLFAGAFGGTDSAADCVAVDPELVKAIRKDPSAYYVNVHSSVFPGGAVRGQLG